jgi:hypothetical protein
MSHLQLCESDPTELDSHDRFVAEMFEQAVRRDAFASRTQGRILGTVERLVIGDARRRGETHQWMYDWANLTSLLQRCGFQSVRKRDYQSSAVEGWAQYGLDLDGQGNEYKPGSLYVEAIKPALADSTANG